MLNIQPPKYVFCPFCGGKLQSRDDDGDARNYCPKDNWTYYPRVATSAVAVILKDNQILLVQRNREPHKGTWMCPSGFIEYGEHPDEAIRREVLEETGLEATAIEMLGVDQADDVREPGHFVFAYKVTVGAGELKTDLHENQDIKWFDVADLPEIAWPTQRIVLVRLGILKSAGGPLITQPAIL